MQKQKDLMMFSLMAVDLAVQTDWVMAKQKDLTMLRATLECSQVGSSPATRYFGVNRY